MARIETSPLACPGGGVFFWTKDAMMKQSLWEAMQTEMETNPIVRWYHVVIGVAVGAFAVGMAWAGWMKG